MKASEVSYVFDLQGPSASVDPRTLMELCVDAVDFLGFASVLRKHTFAKDTACSSSLVGCNMAMAALRGRSCAGALVLGVNVQFQPYWTEAPGVRCFQGLSQIGLGRAGRPLLRRACSPLRGDAVLVMTGRMDTFEARRA